MSSSDWLDYQPLGYCRTCGTEWKLRGDTGTRASPRHDPATQVGFVCPFCGSTDVRKRQELKSP